MNQQLRKRYLRVKICNFSSKTNYLLIYNNGLLKNMNSETLVDKYLGLYIINC
jgi:hypothetical protein